MTASTDRLNVDTAEPGTPAGSGRNRRRRRLTVVMVVVVLVGAGAYVERTNPHGISFSHPLGHQHHSASSASSDNTAGTSLAISRL